jgi:hypothetical protein
MKVGPKQEPTEIIEGLSCGPTTVEEKTRRYEEGKDIWTGKDLCTGGAAESTFFSHSDLLKATVEGSPQI